MRKSLLIIALGLSGAIFFQANATESVMNRQNTSIVMTQEESFVEITLEQVLPAVKTAIEAYAAEYEIGVIEFDAAAEVTRVTFNSKANAGETKVVSFNKEGQAI